MNKEIVNIQEYNLIRRCGHVEEIRLTDKTAHWYEWLTRQNCLACQPIQSIRRICGHDEGICRSKSNGPETYKEAKQQPCTSCQWQSQQPVKDPLQAIYQLLAPHRKRE